jgi:hypothetical protein
MANLGSLLFMTVFGVVALTGCTDDAKDLGSIRSDMAHSPSPKELAPFVGRWSGPLARPLRSDGLEELPYWSDLWLSLDRRGEGYVTFGDGFESSLGAATDPAAKYPTTLGSDPGVSSLRGLFNGFAYPIQGHTMTDDVLTLKLNPGDLFESYCALQTPYMARNPVVDEETDEETDEEVHYCVPERPRYATGGKCFILDREPTANETSADVPMTEFSCEQIGMCTLGDGCQCDATRCTSVNRDTVELELKFNDNELSGSLHGEGMSNEAKVLISQD